MAKLTTHVLDIASGRPAGGMRVELHRIEPGKKTPLADIKTSVDGRALLGEMTSGTYRLLFHVGDYFAAASSNDARKFLDVVPILFKIDEQNAAYHVPLLVSPWAYSTYRGS